jgi:hypothetical protein
MNSRTFMKGLGLTSASLVALALMHSLAAAQELEDVQSNGNLHLRGYGTAFMTGNTHFVDTLAQAPGRQPGLSVINQMHVQFMLPQAGKGKNMFRSYSCTAAP